MDTMMKISTDQTSYGAEGAQAFMKSGQIWTSGCQAIGQTLAMAMQARFERMMAGWKAMSDVKSFKDAVDMQSSLMRASFENTMASTGKIGGATMTLVEESIAPLTACMTLAAEKYAIRTN